MMEQPINPLRKYIRNGKLPHFFCPGCGCGQVMSYFLKATDELGLDLDKVVTIGGVGCTARIPVYLDTVVLHGVHGRTLAWATGIKMHKPDLKVVVFAGDGDLTSIGGNHFIQAARRNLDVTVVMVNNMNFAMTGGQVAPTTPENTVTMTTPYGSSEASLDVCNVAKAAGATYISRWTTNMPNQAVKSLKAALQHKGFSLVEIVSQCPTHFGRYALKSGKPEVTLEWIKDNTVPAAKADKLTEDEKAGKFIVGEFVNTQRPVYAGSTVCGLE